MEKKGKKVLMVELGDDVKKVSVTGMSSDEKVVMHQELSEEDLDKVTGGYDMREERLKEIELPDGACIVGCGYGRELDPVIDIESLAKGKFVIDYFHYNHRR